MERTLTEAINYHYGNILSGARRDPSKIFDTIGFLNRGYWKGVENSPEVAQINLIEVLSGFFSSRDGNILDVACGIGGAARFLTKYFEPKLITGINISEKQLDVCKVVAPACNFTLMDATQLGFEDSTFDNLLCIEAALHFFTRQRFFEEAYRVLRPAGRLAMLDSLCNYELLEEFQAEMLPKENYLPSLDAYTESLSKVGFRHVRVEDCTEFAMTASTNYMVESAEKEFGRTQDPRLLEDIKRATMRARAYRPNCLVFAIK